MMTVSKIFISGLVGAALLFSGCKKDPVNDRPTLSVEPVPDTPVAFSANATESYTFTVTTNAASWQAVPDQSWCVVTQNAGNNTFTITALPNDELTAPAPATVTVTAGEATPVTIAATQAALQYSVEWSLESSDMYGFPGIGQDIGNPGFVVDATAEVPVYSMFSTYDGYSVYTFGPRNTPECKRITIRPSSNNLDWSQTVRWGDYCVTVTASRYLYAATHLSDAEWFRVPVDHSIRRILGAVNPKDQQDAYLAAIAEIDGKYVFVRTSKVDMSSWEIGAEVDAGFPLGGGSACLSYAGKLMLAGGKDQTAEYINTLWSTSDGLNWSKSGTAPFTEGMAGASMAEYKGVLYLIGGENRAGETTKNIVCSPDGGATWQPAGEAFAFPAEFKARAYSFVYVSSDSFFIFGGRESKDSPYLYEVWKGTISRN